MRQPIPFGKYLLLDRVSVGGMAEIFRAKSYGVEGFEKLLAIKRILPSMGEDHDFIKMFIDEAKIVGQMSHANVCQIYELGKIEEAHFIAMEYIWGKDLLQIQNRARKSGQPMPVPMACHVVSKVCEGLDYAHRKRDPMGKPLEIVHRDCSPQNVLVSYEGEVKIIDFGIAKAASRSSRTMAGVLKGKFGYMSPEQVRGLPLDRRSDIFSVGTILYECLTGERLFQGESDFSTLEKVRNVDIQPPRKVNAQIPPQVEAVVMKALSGDVDQRYQWCHEMQADLQRFLMTQNQVFSTKALSDWMKTQFQTERTRERKQLDEYKKIGQDGRPTQQPDDRPDDLLAGLDGADAEATVLGDPGFGNILAGRRAHSMNDFADEAPTEIYGDSHDDLDNLDELSVSAPIPVSPAEHGSAEASTVIDDGALQALVANLQSARDPAPANPTTGRGTGPAPGAQSSQPSPPTVQFPPMVASATAPHPGQQASRQPGQQAGPFLPAPPFGAGTGPTPGAQPPMPSGAGPGMYPGTHGYPGATPGGYPPYGQSGQLFGSTSHVAPLSDDAPAARRRSSLGKDIGIGIGIAVLVLGLFAAGKFLLFKDKDEKAAPPQRGTVAVTLAAGTAADVFVGKDKRGTVTPEKALRLELDLGVHNIKVTRDDALPCEQQVTLEDANVEQEVACALEPKKPPTGTLRIDGVSADYAVMVDGQALDENAKLAPIELSADTPHVVTVERDGKRAELSLTLSAGREEVRDIADVMESAVAVEGSPDKKTDDKKTDDKKPDRETSKPDRDKTNNSKVDSGRDKSNTDKSDQGASTVKADNKPKVGYLMALTTPWAQVHVDGKNTGKTTPISKRNAIELTPGKHKVTFVVGDKKKTFTVDIKAGETVTLKKVLE